ncbi:MAG TPA: DUF5522 domain-containing protein [Pyrinomonadaceae bacterium]|nr:DUF5522 domain-containing protein [Pyrinomonadaceae bacterium]
MKEQTPLVEGEDFYRDGAYVVFTARFHLKRGYCCESGCRHCPYRVEAENHAADEALQNQANGVLLPPDG